MSGNLIDDVLGVWDDGATAVFCATLLARLRVSDPRTYAGWDANMFGRALKLAGVPTKAIHRGQRVARAVTVEALHSVRQIHEQIVYFVERHGFVKIGTTQNLAARLASLDRGDSAIPGMMIAPVAVLAVMPGGRPVERAIHALFEHLRYDGEWFLLDGPLVAFIQAVAEARAAAQS